MNKLLAPALLALLAMPHLAQAEAYKCKLPNGTLAFQDHPCQGGASGSTVTLPRVQGYAAAPVAPAAAPGPASGGADGDSASAQRAQLTAELRALRCRSARRELAVLNEQRPVYHRDDSGSRVYMEDKDRPAAIAAAQQTVDSECD